MAIHPKLDTQKILDPCCGSKMFYYDVWLLKVRDNSSDILIKCAE